MAGLQHRNDSFRVLFRYNGKQHAFTLGAVSQEEAEAKAAQCDYLLLRLKQGLAVLPSGIGIVEYMESDGRAIPPADPAISKITLEQLRTRYLDTHERSLEANTLDCIRIHFKHLETTLGKVFCVSDLALADLQRYVDKRARDKGQKGRKLSATTIHKEIVTLRTAWNWAATMKMVTGPFPNKGLRYPKTHEKPPFMMLEEIERRIAAGRLTDAEKKDLYDSMYLKVDEITQLLDDVKRDASQPFVYPMVCMAAFTGARRSELLRTQVTDLDFTSKVATIHEKKRDKTKTSTTRRVPMSPFLCDVLKEWLKIHPGGQYLFTQEPIVERSKKRSPTTGHKGEKARAKTAEGRAASVRSRSALPALPVTLSEAHDHLQRAVAKTPWKEMRGWHVFRHSFISACASKGVDQRLVETWAGHMSAEMSRRYAHLYPSTQQAALATVFG